jgi:cell division septation protein DedD
MAAGHVQDHLAMPPAYKGRNVVRNEDNETEILLGNKQLLGIFFVVAVLLGVAFTGGYVVGHGSSKKTATAATTATAETSASNSAGSTGGETHSVGAENSGDGSANAGDNSPADGSSAQQTNTLGPETTAMPAASNRSTKNNAAARHNEQAANEIPEEPAASAAVTGVVPHSGQTFLQVAAVGRSEAEAVADVLHKKGFRAHALPKPGNAKVYRVLIGPIRDTSDLSATRDSLRRTGFRDVIVQHY